MVEVPGIFERFCEYARHHPVPLAGLKMNYQPRAQEKSKQQWLQIARGDAPRAQLLEDIENLSELRQKEDVSPLKSALASMCKALLFAMLGALDESHCIVTPHSWSEWTEFGGDPIPDSPVRNEARYVHAITHRFEGLQDGEFGTGYNNSGYWHGALGHHPCFPALREAAQRVADRTVLAASTAKGPSQFTRTFINGLSGTWSGHAFVRFCEAAAQHPEDVSATKLATEISHVECLTFFSHPYRQYMAAA